MRRIDVHPDCARFLFAMRFLRGYTLLAATEAELQVQLAIVFTQEGLAFERERTFGPENRIDFYLPEYQAGLEVKIAGSPMEVLRQLQRYAAVPEIARLALVTRRARLASLPSRVGETPLHVFSLWRGGL